MKIFLDWLRNFDAIKAVVLAIVAIFTSWYDLKQEVMVSKSDTIQVKRDLEERLKAQDKVDAAQTLAIHDLHEEINRGFLDLRADIRSINSGRKAQ